MKKEKKLAFVILLIAILINCNVYAHPGRTDSNGCHTCRTNCSKWGLSNGQYHCHNGGSSSSNSKPSNSTTNYTKSNIATISSLKIDGNVINISNEMSFTTVNSTPTIIATPTSNKASVEIKKSEKLEYGNNEVTIIVTAEDSTVKQYKLNIILVSNDATLNSIKINDKYIEVSDEMFFTTIDDGVTIDVIANNKNANVIYDQKYGLDIGDNKIIIKVEAEDGKTNKEYILNIKRELSLSDDVGITLFVNDNQVIFNNYNSDIVYISSDISEINIEYELSDKNAEIDLYYKKNIEIGDTTIKFKVIAESGKEQEYVINIHRYSKMEDIIYTILVFGIIGGMGFGIYKLVKKIKLKQKII